MFSFLNDQQEFPIEGDLAPDGPSGGDDVILLNELMGGAWTPRGGVCGRPMRRRHRCTDTLPLRSEVPPHLQVSNGAVAMAKTTLEQLLMRCATPLRDEERAEEIVAAQEKSFHHVTHDLVREVTSPNSTVRKQAMHSLQVLAQVTGKSVTVIMEPHKEVRALSQGVAQLEQHPYHFSLQI